MSKPNTRTGFNKFRMLIPLDRIAVISLSADNRPKQIKMPSRVAMGIEKMKIVGSTYVITRITSLAVTFF